MKLEAVPCRNEWSQDEVMYNLVKGKKAVGMVCLSFLKSGIWVSDVEILPSFRGKGYSHILLKKVDKIAKKYKCPKLVLQVEKSNKIALDLYEKHGYIVISSNDDTHTMIKEVVSCVKSN